MEQNTFLLLFLLLFYCDIYLLCGIWFRMRKTEGEYFRTPHVAALTANANLDVHEMFIQNGMNDFLTKPIEILRQDAVLKKWIPNGEQKVSEEFKELPHSQEKKGKKSDDEVLRLGQNPLIIDSVYAPKASVLVVDDNKVNLSVAETLLELYGIKPHMATSGLEAIKLVKEIDFDMIFMDHMMPVMDGIECTQTIRAFGGKYETIPVIALTANTEIGIGEMFIKSGMDDFISKPIDKKILNMALAKYIPGEKFEKRTNTMVYTAKDTEMALLGKVGEIGEIDIKLGLSRVAERVDAYIKNLDIFIRNEPKFYTNIIAMISVKDINAFAKHVHGIKGSLTNIGAMGISQLAEQLETAAKNNDVIFCEENVGAFTEQLKNLREKLAAVLSTRGEKLKKEKGDMSVLKEKLLKAVSQLDIFDVDGATILLDNLITHTYGEDFDSNLSSARDQINDYQYDLAIETISKVLNAI